MTVCILDGHGRLVPTADNEVRCAGAIGKTAASPGLRPATVAVTSKREPEPVFQG